MQVVGIDNFGWRFFGTILTTFWVLSGNILKCKIHTTDWSYFTEALPETAGCVCLSDSDGDRLNTQFYCAQEDTCFSHQDISSVFQLNGQTWKCFLSVEPMIIIVTNSGDDDDVRQTETSWRRPTSTELTLTYLTPSASYKSQLAKTLYYSICKFHFKKRVKSE